MMNNLRMPPYGQRSGTYCLESRMLVVFQFQPIGSMIQLTIQFGNGAGDLGPMRPWGWTLCDEILRAGQGQGRSKPRPG